ncbi:MAG: type II toxin-antitoxin system RelE/ParE family toxin [Bacteriovoracaceae bacterium]
MYRFYTTNEFDIWLSQQTVKLRGQIQSRLERILHYDHFGDSKILDHNLSELRWKNGTRIYFAITKNENNEIIILLLGGNKNSQKKDINRAKNLMQELVYEKI